jgi:hypothetical protein
LTCQPLHGNGEEVRIGIDTLPNISSRQFIDVPGSPGKSAVEECGPLGSSPDGKATGDIV